MSLIKSFSTGFGDTYYIDHGSDNFSIIDCRIDEGGEHILDELREKAAGSGIVRFISTHPDDDHLRGLVRLDNALDLVNFYVVKNEATKPDYSADFERYRQLRDSDKAFYLQRGSSRRWMNQASDERGSSGLNVLWPITSNEHYQTALASAKVGGSPNNISIILQYSLEGGARVMWFGDLETDFMKNIEDEIDLPPVDVVFAPHHGRARLPARWVSQMDPAVIVLGEAEPEYLKYYGGRDHIRQNATGDITIECAGELAHIYVDSDTYVADFLEHESMPDAYGGSYLGSIRCNSG